MMLYAVDVDLIVLRFIHIIMWTDVRLQQYCYYNNIFNQKHRWYCQYNKYYLDINIQLCFIHIRFLKHLLNHAICLPILQKNCLKSPSSAPRKGAPKPFLNRDDKVVELCIIVHSPRLARFWSSRSWDKWKSFLRYEALISLKVMKRDTKQYYYYICNYMSNSIINNYDENVC